MFSDPQGGSTQSLDEPAFTMLQQEVLRRVPDPLQISFHPVLVFSHTGQIGSTDTTKPARKGDSQK
jgi:hypothetical protein